MSLNNLPPGSLVQIQPPITSRSHHTPSVHWARCLDHSQRVFFNTKVQAGSLKLANGHLKDSKKKTETKNLKFCVRCSSVYSEAMGTEVVLLTPGNNASTQTPHQTNAELRCIRNSGDASHWRFSSGRCPLALKISSIGCKAEIP